MGQQQLLLLVLGAIIVGLAIVVGINLFGQGATKANEDAVRQDIMTMMARVEEFYRKPAMLGGGGKSFDTLEGFPDIGYRQNSDGTALSAVTVYVNENGTFTMSNMTTTPTITGVLAENSDISVAYQFDPDAAAGTDKITTTSSQPAAPSGS